MTTVVFGVANELALRTQCIAHAAIGTNLHRIAFHQPDLNVEAYRQLPEQPGHRPLDSYSSQKRDHGGHEKGNPHLMKGIPLSEFPLCTFRESTRIHSDH